MKNLTGLLKISPRSLKKSTLSYIAPTIIALSSIYNASADPKSDKYAGEREKTIKAIEEVVPREWNQSGNRAKEGVRDVGRGLSGIIDGFIYSISRKKPIKHLTDYNDDDFEGFKPLNKKFLKDPNFWKSLPAVPYVVVKETIGGAYKTLGGIWEIGRQGVNSSIVIPLDKATGETPLSNIPKIFRYPLYITPKEFSIPTFERGIDYLESKAAIRQNDHSLDREVILSTPKDLVLGLTPENMGNAIINGSNYTSLDNRSMTIHILDAIGGIIGTLPAIMSGGGSSTGFTGSKGIGGGVTGVSPAGK